MSEDSANYYYDPHDKKYSRNIRLAAPQAMEAFSAVHRAIYDNLDAALSAKHKELIALAVAVTTKCAYCLESHSAAAKKAGATEEEVVEALLVTTVVSSGACMAHGRMALKFYSNAGES
jgi:AhpD family alkylhydroperoxidase